MLAKAGRGSIMLGAAVARARGAAASTLITMPQRDAAAEGRISSALPSAMRCQVRTLSASTASVSGPCHYQSCFTNMTASLTTCQKAPNLSATASWLRALLGAIQ